MAPKLREQAEERCRFSRRETLQRDWVPGSQNFSGGNCAKAHCFITVEVRGCVIVPHQVSHHDRLSGSSLCLRHIRDHKGL